MVNIFIDPGHGGKDPGAVYNGLMEKNITLAIALNMQRILNESYLGHVIKLSRERDVTLTLQERTQMANRWRADILISVHVNAGKGTGFESFTYNGVYNQKANTNKMRKLIHDEVIRATGFKDRGKKEANFHIVRESRMCAILTENGFIDHEQDARLLKNETFIEKIAQGHVTGLAKAFGLLSIRKVNNHIYVVQQGDTLWRIAQRYETTVDHLLQLNQGIDVRKLQVGQLIRLK